MKHSTILDQLGLSPSNNDIVWLEKEEYRALNYLSLKSLAERPFAAIEAHGQPILYFMNDTQQNQVESALNALSCRSEKAALVILRPGELQIVSIQPDAFHNNCFITIPNEKAAIWIRDCIEGMLPSEQIKLLYGKNRPEVEQLLLDLLVSVGKNLGMQPSLKGKHDIVLALIGRALFTRFLLDRKILNLNDINDTFTIDGVFNKQVANDKEVFSTPNSATSINVWLDLTFNGDLLPLAVKKSDYLSWFSGLEPEVFKQLSFILGHADANGQLPLPEFINFAHVPVGLLSEVYEKYLHTNHDTLTKQKAKKDSVHYTPRNIASFMLSESISSFDRYKRNSLKVLDPSCGAGVFVISALRHLVYEEWHNTRKRPDTQTIRRILYTQINGFDINPSALVLAALGLYLSAIELDPNPIPASKLLFEKNLIGNVLFLADDDGLGSLGKSIDDKHDEKYDLVIGNPPWTSFGKSMDAQLTQCIRNVAALKGLHTIAKNHKNPDQVPDIPFVWKAMQWAKPSGSISFAMHARLLFKNSTIGAQSRTDLFSALNVTGIVNGSELRQTRIWENNDAQFCILFAKNEAPSEENYFHFVSPKLEETLNNSMGKLRIDSKSIHPIQNSAIQEKPYLLKTLFKGSVLDIPIVDNLYQRNDTIAIGKYWSEKLGKHSSGQGYKVASKKNCAQQLNILGGFQFTKELADGYFICDKKLPLFKIDKVEATRHENIYKPPLVLVNKAIGAKESTASVRIYTNTRPLIYNESFYGYSCQNHENPLLLAKYLFITLNSGYFLYYLLMTSSEYGVEREAIQKIDVDNFKIIPLEALSEKNLNKVNEIYDNFILNPNRIILDKFIGDLYGLTLQEKDTVSDTLATELPIASARKKSQSMLTNDELNIFIGIIEQKLRNFFKIKITPVNGTEGSWIFFVISSYDEIDTKISPLLPFRNLADSLSTSKIILKEEKKVIIGYLNQYRYWTKTRARLLFLELMNDPEFERIFPEL